MEWKDILGELVTFIKTASPEVWRIYLIQARVQAVQLATICMALIAVAFHLFTKARWYIKIASEQEWDRDSYEMKDTSNFYWFIFCAVCIVVTVLIALILGRLINPDFYAIKSLLGSFN